MRLHLGGRAGASVLTLRWLFPALSFVATLVLGVMARTHAMAASTSAILSMVVVLATSVAYLGFSPRRLLATAVGLVLAAAPGLVLATSTMMIAGQLGFPVDVLSTRIAALVGWWLALAILRPYVLRIGSHRLPAWLATLLLSPIAGVSALCYLAFKAGPHGGSTAQRFAFLYRVEDNAAWVSQAQAILRHGHLPVGAESEYSGYSPLSTLPAVLGDIAVRGRPASPADAVYRSVDVTVANQLLAICVAAGLLAMALFIGLLLSRRTMRPPVVVSVLSSLILIGVGSSILAGTPALSVGHQSLAWADVAVFLLGLTSVVTLRCRTWLSFLPFAVATWLAAYAAAGAWPYIVLTPVTFAVLLLCYWKSGFRVSDGEPIGHGLKVLALSAGLVTASLLAAAPQFIASLRATGVEGLAGAKGGIAPVEPVTLALVVLVGLAAMAIGYRSGDILSFVAVLLLAGASVSAALVYGSGVLPGNDPTYSLTKSLYVVVAVAPLAAVAVLVHSMGSQHRRVILVGALLASTLITTSPSFGSVLKWWGTVDAQSPLVAQRLLRVSARGAESDHVVCQPSPYVAALDNYMCNRWVAAFSKRQYAPTFRLAVLTEEGSAPAAWDKARADGFLRNATIGNASEVITGTCVPASVTAPTPPGAPSVRVRSTPVPEAKRGSETGSVNTVQQCSDKLVIVGWAPFVQRVERLHVWADGPVSVKASIRYRRPEIIDMPGNDDLVAPGFVLVLDKRPGLARRLCISLDGARSHVIARSNASGCLARSHSS